MAVLLRQRLCQRLRSLRAAQLTLIKYQTMSKFQIFFSGKVDPLDQLRSTFSIADNIAIWQAYTRQGNQFMKLALAQPPNPQVEQAQSVYDRAIDLAKEMWHQAQAQNCHPETIHIYAISCHNLADYYEAVNRNPHAEDLLLEAFDRTLSTMQDPDLAPDFQMEAYRSLHMVLQQLVDFYDRHQNPNAATKIVLKAGQQARQFLDNLNFPPD